MSTRTSVSTSTSTRSPWAGRALVLGGYAVGAVLLFGLAPAVLTDFRLRLLAQFLCVAMVAVGIGLAWGSGGLLTLGQGVFFGLGAYIMAMHLQMADAGPGGRPAFMVTGSGVPWWWELFRNPAAAVVGIVAVPGLLALLLGLGVFKRRVKGAYFAILSQSSAAAFALLLISQQNTIGGSNGLSSFRSFFGFRLADPVNRQMLFSIAAGVLLVMVAVVHQLRRSRYGELLSAVRDGEERVRFLGYDPAVIKVVAYVLAAVFAAIGGALFVPIVGIISPTSVGVVPSIGFLIGVAVGGRASLLGPVLGSLAVSYAGSYLSEEFESSWVYLQGLLFIVVVAFLPGGLASLGRIVRGRLRRRDPAEDRAAGTGDGFDATGPPLVDDAGAARAPSAVPTGGA